jgi:putative transposase
MPRFARVAVAECAHHVTQRGNARRDVFYSTTDRQVYLGLLQEYSQHYQLKILGYCLMTNHVHLVVEPATEHSMARALREVHGRYARYRNALDRSSGHVWQNRYYSCAVEAVGLGAVMRYVELNPVRAGLVSSAGDYVWSSAVLHLGGGDAMGLVDDREWRRDWSVEEWTQMLGQGAAEAAAIREATYGGRPFGSEQFMSTVERQLGRRIAAGKPGRPRKSEVQAVGAGGKN